MFIAEEFIRAEDDYRREQYRQDNRKKASFRKAAAVVVLASIILAACAVPAEDAASQAQANSVMIQDLAPVGIPGLADRRTYQAPEMWPVFVGNRAYQAPEMFPTVSAGSLSGTITGGSLINDLAPVGIPRVYEAPEMWPVAKTQDAEEDTRTSGPR